MDIKEFIQKISPYTLTNMSILKRLGLASDMKTLKELRDKAIKNNYLTIQEYENLRCFSVTSQGFSLIGIEHQPKLQFTPAQADMICRNNHLRIGFEQSLKPTQIQLKWITGGKFIKSPLYIRFNKREHNLQPSSIAVLRDNSGRHRVYVMIHFRDTESLNSELYLYSKYEEKGLHIKRFYLDPQAEIRIIVLVESYKQAWQIHNKTSKAWQNKLLFLPVNKVHAESLLKRDVFFNTIGERQSVL